MLDLNDTLWMPVAEKCEPIEELLKAQGVGLIKRKLINKMAGGAVLNMKQTADTLTITSEGIKTRVDTIGLNWSGHKKTGELGAEEWNVRMEDDKLICEITIVGKGVRTVTRHLANEKELVTHLQWKGNDGQTASAKRVFKKVKRSA
mmetsp:Transcript_132253/g.186714  ORF Transcript_132253/g.186714 Transcript_132253/m.186714 type:complete len:147 (+) Transcript_132253:62-502(+)